jgi:hypothetical protein
MAQEDLYTRKKSLYSGIHHRLSPVVTFSGHLEVKFTKTGGKKRFSLLGRLWQFVVARKCLQIRSLTPSFIQPISGITPVLNISALSFELVIFYLSFHVSVNCCNNCHYYNAM